MPHQPTPAEALTVSQITYRIKDALQELFPQVWICGEISNLARPQSGHVYLTLKDDRAQLRAAIWRSTAGGIRFDLEDGLEVLCLGSIDLYPPRGNYQLIIRRIEPVGLGPLELAYRQLHAKLEAEGLFDPRWKKPLPRFPRRIALVTSPTGAAIRDFLQVLRRRWRPVEVLVLGVPVQGSAAAEQIAAAIQSANQLRPSLDLLVVARGGGSLEDLWCFNEEIVARSIFASQVPVVSAVGHEIDVTLSDFVADVRALTPSEAAERITPSEQEIKTELGYGRQRLETALHGRLQLACTRLAALTEHRVFRRPLDRLRETAERIDDLDLRLTRAITQQLARAGEQLALSAKRLDSLSPLAVLERGYTITTRADDDSVVRRAASLTPGDSIFTQFPGGRAVSRILRVQTTPAESDAGN